MRPPAKQAENRPGRRAEACTDPSFNEAACKTGGKLALLQGAFEPDRASMRPPAKQAENGADAARRSARRAASMRPPAKQAENGETGVTVTRISQALQ